MDTIQELLPPHSIEAEQAVIGSIMIDPDAILDVSEIVTAGDFYRPAYRYVYEAIHNLYQRQEPFDTVTIGAELESAGRMDDIGGWSALLDLLNAVPTSINAEAYAAIVAEKAQRRRLLLAAGTIAKAAYNENLPIDDARAAAESAVMGVGGNDRGQVRSARRSLSDYIDNFTADVTNPTEPRVVATGLTDLDRLLGGLEAPHQYLLAGRTSMGKSALMLGIVLHAVIRQGKRVLLFSLEMSEEQIHNRLLVMMTGIPGELFKPTRRHEMSVAQQSQVMEAAGRLSDSALYIDASAELRPADVRNRAARIYAAHGLDLIVVDHMHIMRPNAATGNQVHDLGSIAIDLATVYKTFNVAGLTLAQVNRGVDSRAVKMPILSDLRESGRIEEAAYAVTFVHREGYYDPTAAQNVAQVIVAKHRDGPTGSVEVYWRPERAMYGNLSKATIHL